MCRADSAAVSLSRHKIHVDGGQIVAREGPRGFDPKGSAGAVESGDESDRSGDHWSQ